MSNFATANTVENEIIKAVDFAFSHDQAINNIAVAMRGILADPSLDLVIGGTVRPYISGGMNVSIDPVYAHCGSNGMDVVETELKQPVSFEAASQNLDRIDIIQVRGIAELYDFQDRRFRDPETKVETTSNMPTKKRVELEIVIKRGSDGSVAAPPADTGYVKLAEIYIPAGTVGIDEENIRNITARYGGEINDNWTIQHTRTFNPGYLTDIMAKFLVSHGGDGKLKANAVLASMIKFGNGNGDVNGSGIPTGLSMEVSGTQYNALASVSQVLAALSTVVNSAHSYTNNLLSRYVLLADSPVATSTGNSNVTTGGVMTIDGVACSTGQLVLLKDQANPKENGFWEVQTGAWNRYPGYTTSNPAALNNKFIYSKTGSFNHGKIFYMEKEASIGLDNLIFYKSIFSPVDLSGTIPIRDMNGRTHDDEKRETAIAELKLDSTRHADMIDGMGRNLLEVLGVSTISEAMAEIRRRCNNNGEIASTGIPDFRGIEIGDYIDGINLDGLPVCDGGTAPQAWNDTYKNNRIVVAGFNTYKGTGYTENDKNHVIFVFRDVIALSYIGDANEYANSEVSNWLDGNGGNGVVAGKLKEQLGGEYLYTISRRYNQGGLYQSALWLPTETEICGCMADPDMPQIQIPLYQRSYDYRIKRHNGLRHSYWTQTVNIDSGGYVVCGSDGPLYIIGGDSVIGVAPVFCVA